MTQHRVPRPVPTGFSFLGMAAIVLIVSGCAVVDDVVHGKAATTYSTAAELADDRDIAAAWLPDDATEIEVVSSTRTADTASIVFRSDEGVRGCVTTERRSAPTMVIDSGPDVYAIDEVMVCGDWAVVESDGLFSGWTPAVEAEGD
ncbi:hypothetical protein [Microbacterium dauci]|uniref:Lipoprotein n=1 Tax=Microbacterium dauci TaxID=3048008 RepID=A0ABT6ZEH2_9MICO|nr:hypothetical protein [Microbacterium sp. LX3-4]MDJ1114561.1 hypothetical protein [Microbacterium sp. LX3-4]